MSLAGRVRRPVRRLRLAWASRNLSAEAKRVREERLTYLTPTRLRTLERAVAEIDRNAVPGDIIECGVALGGSAVLLATRLGDGRRFHGYDVFGQIPPPGENDPPEVHERYAVITAGKSTGIGGDVYYGYRADLLEHVSATFERYGLVVGERIQLHKGLFEDTLHPDGAIALAHIDSDWYDPVKLCLERIHPKLSPGGLIVLDDYFDWGGCRRATDEFLASRPDMDIVAVPDNVVLAKRR